MKELEKEVEVLKTLSHPNIVRYLVSCLLFRLRLLHTLSSSLMYVLWDVLSMLTPKIGLAVFASLLLLLDTFETLQSISVSVFIN